MVEEGQKGPPPFFWAMPERKRFFFCEVIPKRSQPSLLRKIEYNFWSKDCQDYWTDGNGLYKREGI